MLELAQVAELVPGRQVLLTRPFQGFAQLPLRDPDLCLQRGDGPHPGQVTAHILALGLEEHVERAVQVSFGRADPSHGDTPAIRVLLEASVVAQFLAHQQVPHGGIEIVPFEG